MVERETTLAVPGVALRAVEVGEVGPEIVVLHGGPGAGLDYLRPQIDRLAHGRRLLYFDQRGGGGSRTDHREVVTAGRLVEDLEAIRRLRHTERLTLLGYSWGGLLALLYAVEHPAHVERMALLSTAPPRASLRPQMEQGLRERQDRPGARALAEQAAREPNPDRARRLRFAAAVSGYFVNPARALDLTPFVVVARTQESVWQSLGDYDLRPRLATIHAPVLLVHGMADPVPIAGAEEIVASLPGAELVRIADAAHVPYVEGAEDCFAALESFLPRQA